MNGPAPVSADYARRVFLLLTATRWFPVGLVVGVFTLLALERGLSIGETLSYGTAQGVLVMLLELPTSGFADSFGRKPLLIVSGAVNIVAGLLYLQASSFWGFAAAAAAMGLFRALDSGPLEAWYVDAAHAGLSRDATHDAGEDPAADTMIGRVLARQGTVLGAAIALGALVSGGLIAWHPAPAYSALALPVLLSTVLGGVHLLLVAVLLREVRAHPSGAHAVRRALDSARQTPAIVTAALRLVRRNRVLAGIISVEIGWMAAMTVFENLQPVRMSELLGSESAAGAIGGPVASAGWVVFALGSALAGLVAARIGLVRTAIGARILNGAGALVMGLMTNVPGLVGAYAGTYAMHGAAGPMHSALLHREADASNRSTVLSLNSLVAFGFGAFTAPSLGWLAQATSTQTAMVVGGAVSIIGFVGYLPALRAERRPVAAPS